MYATGSCATSVVTEGHVIPWKCHWGVLYDVRVPDVTTLHETFSAKLLSHDVISLECETKHTNLTMVNERQNNVTSCTNCSYLFSIFIPLNVDNVGEGFYLFTLFLPLFHWILISLGIVFIYFYLSLKKNPNYF